MDLIEVNDFNLLVKLDLKLLIRSQAGQFKFPLLFFFYFLLSEIKNNCGLSKR